mmetsp:Transcript_43374/g.85969  ORF Transcript_43374/g.85969 Transcript_43374/m.85969 type:complete len:524 (+) Transcript_43374:81-1652(+)|eukprot:CAMPEP_0172690140 /NCGR_PEP_ID=MMETSP1074-20121228/23641_1 /TAXON_ID=2916 /ORGANISM="Ceratium fusus, Strain PA161109" /LENGTH=523 /DNA_ID=CAMNT_0013510047 /DNA_START=85 /DNA_END=1656 /DNA_ORIENTATION=-
MLGMRETGVDFVQRVIKDLKVVQDDIVGLKKSVGELQMKFYDEERSRAVDVKQLHDRVSEERAAETHLRNQLQNKQDAFEEKTKIWVGALGQDNAANREQILSLESRVAERAKEQAAIHNERFDLLDHAVSTKAPINDLEQLQAAHALLNAQVDRDNLAVTRAVNSAEAVAKHDFKVVQDGVERLQNHLEAINKSRVDDIAKLAGQINNVDTFARTRASEANLQALEPRVFEAERWLERLNIDVEGKASNADANNLSDRLMNLTQDVKAHEVRNQVDKETIRSHIGSLERGIDKNGRQLDSDRERTSNCIVALEKEVNTKAAKQDTDLIGPHILQEATQRLEARSFQLDKQLGSTKEELGHSMASIKALQATIMSKADASEITEVRGLLADHSSLHHTAYVQEHERSQRLKDIDDQLVSHHKRLEDVDRNSNHLVKAVSSKAESKDHLSREHTHGLLEGYYRKEEIDALLSRVWWRTGDESTRVFGDPTAENLRTYDELMAEAATHQYSTQLPSRVVGGTAAT